MTMRKMHIDGQWVDAQSGQTRTIVNPFDGSSIAQVPEGDREDARAAIRAARQAFDRGPWQATSAYERRAPLHPDPPWS